MSFWNLRLRIDLEIGSLQVQSIKMWPYWSACMLRHACRVRLCYPMDHSLPGSSVQGISQARVLEQVAISFSWGSSPPRDWACISCVSCTAGGFFTTEPPGKSWNRMSLNLICLVSLKRKDSEQSHTGRRWAYGSQGKDERGASTSQGMPRVANKYQKLEEARMNSPLQALQGAWPYLHLASEFLAFRAMIQYISWLF